MHLNELYAEAAMHCWRPARTKAVEEFIVYAQRPPGAVFLRKDQIAQFALESSATGRESSLVQQWIAA